MAGATRDGSGNGRVTPDTTLTRVMLRPIGSPLPLGAFTLVPAGLLPAGLQLGWFAPHDAKAIPLLILGFAVPLQLSSSLLAFMARDALVGTGFGIFSGVWLAFGLAGSARFILSGLYESTSNAGVEHAAGIVGLVFVGVAGYVGLATLLEDTAKRRLLPMGRRSRARAAIDEGLGSQLHELETEAGVREQL